MLLVCFQCVISKYICERKALMLKQQLNNNNQESLDDGDERDSESIAQNLMVTDIDELYQSKQRLKDFIKNLGEFHSTGIQKSVLQYYNKINERVLVPENVLRMAGKRVDKMLKNKKIKKNWSSQDVNILIWCLSKYLEKQRIYEIDRMTSKDWDNIAQLIPGSTGDRCMFKWLSLKKFNLANYRWQQTESNILSKLVNQNSIKDWKNISQKLYKMNEQKNKIFRNAKQCRQHWSCYLNPKLKKGPWQIQEDKKLLQCILSNNGQKKWSEIARKFHGRTQNALKNRYNLIIQKQKKISNSKTQLILIKELLSLTTSHINKAITNFKQQIACFTTLQPSQINNNNEDQIYNQDQENNDYFKSNIKEKEINSNCIFINDDSDLSPVKIVKTGFEDMMKLMKNRHADSDQLIPAILTNNNKFLINMVYGAHSTL